MWRKSCSACASVAGRGSELELTNPQLSGAFDPFDCETLWSGANRKINRGGSERGAVEGGFGVWTNKASQLFQPKSKQTRLLNPAWWPRLSNMAPSNAISSDSTQSACCFPRLHESSCSGWLFTPPFDLLQQAQLELRKTLLLHALPFMLAIQLFVPHTCPLIISSCRRPGSSIETSAGVIPSSRCRSS